VARRFVGQGKNTGFVCANCARAVPPLANGSYRNHCPYCLHSLHVDINPGDRASDCGGLLKPIGVDYSGKKGWVIVSQCQHCKQIKRNKAALEDANVADDFEKVLELSHHL
jgi:DNA-directed RNA polymerase subunit RPC12/RpoP